MTQFTEQTYLLVGTVTKDLLPDNSFTTGGTVTYAASIAKQLDWEPIIITAAASDFEPPAYLADVRWHLIPSPETTTFRNEYTPQGRRQTIGPVGRSIEAADIPELYHRVPLVHLCPLAQDVDPAVTAVFDQSLRTATLQGWMRQWDVQGTVSLGGWEKIEPILPKLQVAVISIEDIEGNWTLAEKWAGLIPTLIVTCGEEGCVLFHQQQRQVVPPRPSHPTDPTGAGDVFAAAFFIRFCETNNLWLSARFANVAASMAIERPGPTGTPSRDEIETYMAENLVAMP